MLLHSSSIIPPPPPRKISPRSIWKSIRQIIYFYIESTKPLSMPFCFIVWRTEKERVCVRVLFSTGSLAHLTCGLANPSRFEQEGKKEKATLNRGEGMRDYKFITLPTGITSSSGSEPLVRYYSHPEGPLIFQPKYTKQEYLWKYRK